MYMYMYLYSVPELLVTAERGGVGRRYQCLELRYQIHPLVKALVVPDYIKTQN